MATTAKAAKFPTKKQYDEASTALGKAYDHVERISIQLADAAGVPRSFNSGNGEDGLEAVYNEDEQALATGAAIADLMAFADFLDLDVGQLREEHKRWIAMAKALAWQRRIAGGNA